MSDNNFRGENERLVAVPDVGLIPEQTDRLTVDRKMTLPVPHQQTRNANKRNVVFFFVRKRTIQT
jgi:hypothetical protein